MITPLPGQIWQHYKGGTYEILTCANHTETQEVLVIYRSVSFGSVYARPLSIWYDEITVAGQKKKTQRFVQIITSEFENE
jgi:hypothetical protein